MVPGFTVGLLDAHKYYENGEQMDDIAASLPTSTFLDRKCLKSYLLLYLVLNSVQYPH